MPKVAIRDTVRLLPYPKDHMNAFARVVKVVEDRVWVTNLNMPFSGTLSMHPFKLDDVQTLTANKLS